MEIWRGAPAADSHPELEHAFLALDNPAIHQAFIRHRWTWEVPDYYDGLANLGEDSRRYMILQANGAEINWTLVLRFQLRTPAFVWKAIASAFNATPKRKETAMKPAGPDQQAKPATLAKGTVPEGKAPPPATKEGIESVISGTS